MPDVAAEQNPLAMSDEDFLNQPLPGAEVIEEVPADKPSEVVTPEAKVETVETKVEPQSTEVEVESNVASTTQPTSKPDANGGNVPTEAEVKQESTKDAATASAPEVKPAGDAKDTQGKDAAEGTDATKPAGQAASVDYEALYKRVMTPFKANGKQIELRSIDEAIQLMQMGANYTRKMQDMAPHRKTLLMLDNNQLMDPDKLSFLIDLNNGNPAAIQKLLKEKGVDPMSIDTEQESNYLGGNHKVSDEEVAFKSILGELTSNQDGKVTLQTINSTWDQASKEVLWKEPQLMQTIHEQRENGIYDRIATEVNRQRTLGIIPAGLPFIDAYQAVGNELQKAGAFVDLVAKQPPPVVSGSSDTPVTPVTREPVATRIVAPKPAVSNSDQASAAAATRSTPREVKQLVNPLAMSDEEFLKKFENRL
jgi:hypothetical protein